VAVVAARHDPRLPRFETDSNVDIYRCPVVAKVSRGLVSPTLPATAARLARRSHLLHLNLPMLEAGLIARLASPTPVVSMVHIDLWLPPSRLNSLAIRVTDAAARTALRRSAATVAYSADQALASKYWPIMSSRRFVPIAAPCQERAGGTPRYRETAGLHVGFMGRIVEEKGIDYLIEAFRGIDDPNARLLIAGDSVNVAGGSNIARLKPALAADDRIRLLGMLSGRQIADFYESIDVFALPSIAESFGIVQAEAMMAGVPSVTTDLPGGRFPVRSTGFGRVVPLRDPAALRAAILELSGADPAWRAQHAADARQRFGVEACLNAYEELFDSLREITVTPAST
jgi:glycosyltransferase involved in cell wall biosynthesis